MTANVSEVLKTYTSDAVNGGTWMAQNGTLSSTLLSSGTLGRAAGNASSVNASGVTAPQFAALMIDAGTSNQQKTGCKSVTVSDSGIVTTVIRTGDGSDASMKGTASCYLMADGTVPEYVGLYGAAYPAKGYLAGIVKLDWTGANAVSVLSGNNTEMEWKRPAASGGVLFRKLTLIGSRYDTTLSASNVYGSLSGLRISVYQNAQEALPGNTTAYFGIQGVRISSSWVIDTTVVPTAEVSPTPTNITKWTMSNAPGSPIVLVNLYDATGVGKLLQSQGVILQNPPPTGSYVVTPGVYGVIPYNSNNYEWSLR